MSKSSHAQKKFNLSVTPLVYRILTHHFGHPVAVNQRSHREICNLLQVDPIFNTNKLKSKLTKEIELVTYNNLAKVVLDSDREAIGVNLHMHYLYKMYEFIYMYVEIAKVGSAYKAIQVFYEENGLSDDDLLFDTAYRGWTRYKKSQQKQRSKRKGESVPRIILFPVHKKLVQFKADMEGVKVTSRNIEAAFSKVLNNKVRQIHREDKKIGKIYYLLLKEVAGMSYRQISDRVGLTRNPVRYHIKDAIRHIGKTKTSAVIFEKVLLELRSNLSPVLLSHTA